MKYLPLIALVTLLLWMPAAQADCRARVVVEKKVIIKEVIHDVTPVLAVYLPLYIAPGYIPQQPPAVAAGVAPQQPLGVQPRAEASPPQNDIQALLAEMRKMNSRLDALERRGGAPPMPPPGDVPEAEADAGLGVLRTHCAPCHTKGREAKGTSFAMFDGGALAAISAPQAVKVLGKMQFNEMPPPNNAEKIPPLTDQEYADASRRVQRAVLARK